MLLRVVFMRYVPRTAINGNKIGKISGAYNLSPNLNLKLKIS